jgi:tetratricopeptide (TPR) repeat protein
VSAADKAYSEGMAALRDGAYERALDLFAAAWKEKPGHSGVSAEFDGAILALKKSGDAAYVQGKPEDAGKRWMGTIRYMNHPAAKPKGYPFTRADVQGQIDRLTAGLMEKGLLDYRKGDIETAIADWKTILSYDPGNEEAAKAIRTATTQLENLKKLPPAPGPR